MKEILQYLTAHKTLGRQEAREILTGITTGKYNLPQVASFLTVYMMRMITVDELAGFRDALLDLCLYTDLGDFETIDLCGTGGDGKNTFNISTLSSFVVAGAGYKVAKHGNYGVSSSCGSSNVMEYFGYKFTSDRDVLLQQLDSTGICFLHAPLFHPAMKQVGPIRRDLGVKTFFNMLGPMVNPSFPKNQIIGVFSLETARLYNYIYQQGDKNYKLIYSLDGYDEISLTGDFKMISNTEESLLGPAELGFAKVSQESLYGGTTVKESSDIFLSVLKDNGTREQNSSIIVNAGMAIECISRKTRQESFELAEKSLKDGTALKVFVKLCESV
jgi:anthranilate phosphoribosyltransferase